MFIFNCLFVFNVVFCEQDDNKNISMEMVDNSTDPDKADKEIMDKIFVALK